MLFSEAAVVRKAMHDTCQPHPKAHIHWTVYAFIQTNGMQFTGC